MAFGPNIIITEGIGFRIKNATKLPLDFRIQTTFKEQAINVISKKEKAISKCKVNCIHHIPLI